jgi:DnaK suppressor protein
MALTQQALRKYEKLLRQYQQALEQGVTRTVEEALNSAPEEGRDIGDQAVSAYQKEMLFTAGTQNSQRLSLVRRALGRIADSSYGTCQLCGAAIGGKRLEALPWTPYCIDCQERVEKGEVQEAVDAG